MAPPKVTPNIALYERFGFEVTGDLQIGHSPVVHPVVRPARA